MVWLRITTLCVSAPCGRKRTPLSRFPDVTPVAANITGPEARRLPKKGFGVARLRQRLHAAGIDPDSIGSPEGPRRVTPTAPPPADDSPEDELRTLRKLHEDGVLTDEEYERKKAELESP